MRGRVQVRDRVEKRVSEPIKMHRIRAGVQGRVRVRGRIRMRQI